MKNSKNSKLCFVVVLAAVVAAATTLSLIHISEPTRP